MYQALGARTCENNPLIVAFGLFMEFLDSKKIVKCHSVLKVNFGISLFINSSFSLGLLPGKMRS